MGYWGNLLLNVNWINPLEGQELKITHQENIKLKNRRYHIQVENQCTFQIILKKNFKG